MEVELCGDKMLNEAVLISLLFCSFSRPLSFTYAKLPDCPSRKGVRHRERRRSKAERQARLFSSSLAFDFLCDGHQSSNSLFVPFSFSIPTFPARCWSSRVVRTRSEHTRHDLPQGRAHGRDQDWRRRQKEARGRRRRRRRREQPKQPAAAGSEAEAAAAAAGRPRRRRQQAAAAAAAAATTAERREEARRTWR